MTAGHTPVSPSATTAFFDFNDVSVVTTSRHDRDEIRARLLDRLESVLVYLFPHGKRRGAQFLVGNLRGEPGDSLVVELEGEKRGVWIDFATGESGDILALWASVRRYALPTDFGTVLEEVADWLGGVFALSVPVIRTAASDDLGPNTAKWDYTTIDGELIACVYRYDPPSGKAYRPWDVRARMWRAPDPRPLYNQRGITQTDTVVLVEGEKCADALIHAGIAATTAMNGANAPVDKTDWSPLAGKTVVIWPDHDEAGEKYADAIVPALVRVGARVRRVAVPADKPKKWDAADAVDEDFDVVALIAGATLVAGADSRPALDIRDWCAVERFIGEPKARRWLVEGVFPQAQAALVAAAGGVGKSFLLLSLAREVATFFGSWRSLPRLFGGELVGHGVAIYITAEDDAIEIHSRLNALGSIPDGLYVVPLPDAGGATPLFAPDPHTRGPAITAAWSGLERQFREVPDLRVIVLDPLQPLCALDLNVPENAQFVCSRLAALAASTGASVIVSHHFAKREASTPEQAREAIRGTGGLVDGVRSVYALWHPKEDQAVEVCNALITPHERGKVVMGGVVKANGRANLSVATFVRDARGLLVDRSRELARAGTKDADLLSELKLAIAHAAAEGKPYTKSGGNGVYERRHELPRVLHGAGKHRLAEWIGTLLDTQEVVLAMADGSKLVKWLDVPDGPVAKGKGQFMPGHLDRSASGRPRAE